jgi:hypothetical protein
MSLSPFGGASRRVCVPTAITYNCLCKFVIINVTSKSGDTRKVLYCRDPFFRLFIHLQGAHLLASRATIAGTNTDASSSPLQDDSAMARQIAKRHSDCRLAGELKQGSSEQEVIYAVKAQVDDGRTRGQEILPKCQMTGADFNVAAIPAI